MTARTRSIVKCPKCEKGMNRWNDQCWRCNQRAKRRKCDSCGHIVGTGVDCRVTTCGCMECGDDV